MVASAFTPEPIMFIDLSAQTRVQVPQMPSTPSSPREGCAQSLLHCPGAPGRNPRGGGRYRSSLFASAAALLLASTPALAQFGVRVLVEADGEFRSMQATHDAAESITRSFIGPPPHSPYSLAIATAEVHHGRLHVTAYRNNEGTSNSQATARAQFEDTIVIQAPVPPGTMGYFVARVRVDGALHASGYNIGDQPDQPGQGSASYFTRLEADTPFDSFSASLSGLLDSSGQVLGVAGGTVQRRIDFAFGEPIEILVVLFARASTGGNSSTGASGLARSAYGNSAYWSGLAEVFTVDDQPLPDFTITSASGTDYRIDFGLDPLFRHGFDN